MGYTKLDYEKSLNEIAMPEHIRKLMKKEKVSGIPWGSFLANHHKDIFNDMYNTYLDETLAKAANQNIIFQILDAKEAGNAL